MRSSVSRGRGRQQAGHMLLQVAIAVAAVAMVVGYGSQLWMERKARAELRHDYAAVQATALEYARDRCSNLPTAPVSLATVLTATGREIVVDDSSVWSIAMSAGQGAAGALLNIRYAAVQGSWQAAVLLGLPGAEWGGGVVAIPVDRQQAAGQKSDFQFLVDGGAC